MMLRFLTTNFYSPVDVAWLGVVTLAWHDREYLAAFAIAMIGSSLSGLLAGWCKRREPEGRG